ncbi:MAG: hypothetical protein ACREQN_11820 [Candidatus Binataceae bacterium]
MNIKRTLTAAAAFASALILAGAMATPVMAQMASAPNLNGNPYVNPGTNYGKHHVYTERFNSYLDGHPDVAQQLRQNPKLINDPHYLKTHPSLRDYLHKHPNVAQAYRSHPERFMHRENKYQNSDNYHGEAKANYQQHHDQDWNQHHGESGAHYQEHHEQHHDQGWNQHHDQPRQTN